MSKRVCAILPVLNRNYVKLAKKTVDLFLRQHFVPIELLIVNGSDVPIITENTEHLVAEGITLRELSLAYSQFNLSALYNAGILATEAQWIVPLNPKIYSHPARIGYQLAQVQGDNPCLLTYQIAIDLSTALATDKPVQPTIKLIRNLWGIATTMIFPRVIEGELVVYDETLNHNEQEELLQRLINKGTTPTFCCNLHTALVDGMNWPMLSVAFHTGSTELEKLQFDQYTAVEGKLSNADYAALARIFTLYDFQVTNALV
jgi:glycosyltransferase involved in cell wall biosynthesis